MADSAVQEPEDRLGMTDAQWARWQAYTHGYGEQDANGIDVSLIRENLRFSSWERLEKLERNVTSFKEDRREAKQVNDFSAYYRRFGGAGTAVCDCRWDRAASARLGAHH